MVKKKIGTNPGRMAGEDAAAAINAELCICPMDSDFNDLMVKQGIDAVKQALEKTRMITRWEKPVPLKEDTAPELDHELLTGIIGEMARAVSIATETPYELSAGLMLSVIATACQGKFMVQVKPGYQEPVNLWNKATKLADWIDDPESDIHWQERTKYVPQLQEMSLEIDRLKAKQRKGTTVENIKILTASRKNAVQFTHVVDLNSSCPAKCKATDKCYGVAYFDGKPGKALICVDDCPWSKAVATYFQNQKQEK